MNISQRLRACAKHTGLDAVIELLNEAADEIDALHARANGQATQPAEVTDADIVAVMRDGNNCNYNDEAEHIQFARAILALRPVQVPMTPDEIVNARNEVQAHSIVSFAKGVYAAEAHHFGITAQAKKETP